MSRRSRYNESSASESLLETTWRAAIYLRLSVEDGDDIEQNSIGNQKKLCLAYLEEKNDISIVDIYIDEAVIIGLKPPSTNGRRFSPISITGHFPI